MKTCKAITVGAVEMLLDAKRHCDFCLEPAGDSPYRKSLADSMAFGCVPIFFHPMTDNANEWLWGGWKEASRVYVERGDYLKPQSEGGIILSELIESCPPALLQRYKATIMRYARRFQVSLFDDVEPPYDAVHMMLERAAEYAESQQLRPKRGRHES